ncbi:M48 family metalloprotease [Leptospira sp. GIMC2001]|uniref:M48 family metalloprotease n=1 Tax=Leptospira sp. GIMC2001 TaxID=1513297 RepID=UPI00234B7EFF|nr:M48 family metalloprotease [Leptospira sp. GIMC2001]WCL48126.1 M48 family metalloprotease [Leptospira sp. GIMC2001]
MISFFRKINYLSFWSFLIGYIICTSIGNFIYADTVYYVQSPKAKLLANPKMDAASSPIEMGASVRSLGESGLFVQVRHSDKTGWISKLFLSTFPPGKQMKLGASNAPSESLQARQRASDFTKTAAARGLSETEKLRIRGASNDYDFDSLRWLEKIGRLDSPTDKNSDIEVNSDSENSNKFLSFFQDEIPATTKLEVKMGRSLAAKLISKYGLVRSEENTKYINEIGHELSSVSSRTDLSFRFGILDTDEINAFACPGGFVFLTKGSIRVMESESELANVLAHEISHIVLNHHGKFQDNNLFLEVLSSLLASSGGEVVTNATSEALSELENEFFERGRDERTEWDADESAIYLASQLGYQTRSFPDYLKRIAEQNQSAILSKTHPSAFQRTKKLEKAFISLLGYDVSRLDNTNFNKLKNNL